MEKELRLKISVDKKTGNINVVSKELGEMSVKASSASKSIKDTSSNIKTFSDDLKDAKTSMLSFAAGAGAIYAVKEAFDLSISTGFSYNSQMEDSKASLTALSVAVQDKTIPVVERYAIANIEATNTLKELQTINAETPHSLLQTNDIYNAMYVSMKKAGASTEEIISLTKQISIAAAAGKIEFNSLLAGVDGLASGTVLASSDLGKFLSSLGLTNEALKESENVVKLLQEKLNDFKAPDTMRIAVSGLGVEWDNLTGKLTSSSFEKSKEFIKDLTGEIKTLSEHTDEIADVAVQATEIGTALVITTGAMKGYSAATAIATTLNATYGASFNALNAKILLTTVSTRALTVATNAIPFVAIASGAYMLVDALMNANDEYERMKKLQEEASKGFTGDGILTDLRYEAMTKQVATAYDTMEAREKAYQAVLKTGNEKVISYYKAQYDEAKSNYSKLEKEYVAYSNKLFITDEERKKDQEEINKLTHQERLKDFEFEADWQAFLNEEKKEEIALINQKNELIDQERKKIADASKMFLDPIDEIDNKYWDIAEKFGHLFDDDQMTNFFKKWREEIEKTNKEQEEYKGIGSRDWTAGLEGSAKSIANISNALSDISDEQKNWTKFSRENEETEKDKSNHIQNQLGLYGNLAGSVSNMFRENSKEAAAFNAIQDALALSSAVTAIASSGVGDPYTAIPRIVAMTALMSSLLSNIGMSIGVGGSGSVSKDSFAAKAESTGTYTSFGDSSKASESISNSLRILEDFAQPQYSAVVDMRNSMYELNANIEKFVVRAVSTGATTEPEFQTSNSMSYSGAASLPLNFYGVDKILGDSVSDIIGNGIEFGIDTIGEVFGGKVEGIIGGAISSVFGGKTTTSLNDYGVTFNRQLVDNAIESIKGSQYQVIKTKTDGGLFSSDKTSLDSTFSDMGVELTSDMSNTIASIYNSVLTSATALGMDATSVMDDLSNYMIEEIKISFKDKTAEEIQQQFTDVIGSIADGLAIDALAEDITITIPQFFGKTKDIVIGQSAGLLDEYRKVGEGMSETLTRVATDLTVVNKALSLANVDINGDVISISESLIDLSGSLTNFADMTANYYGKYFTVAEKLEDTQALVSEVFSDLNITAPKTYEEFRSLVESLDLGTEAGRNTYIELMGIADTFTLVADAAKNSSNNIKSWQDSFKSPQALVQDLAENVGESYYESIENLKIAAKELESGVGGLTDAELEYLNANRALIEQNNANRLSQAQFIDSIYGTNTATLEIARTMTGFTDELPNTINRLIELRQSFIDNDGTIDTYEQTILDATMSTDAMTTAISNLQVQTEDFIFNVSGTLDELFNPDKLKTQNAEAFLQTVTPYIDFDFSSVESFEKALRDNLNIDLIDTEEKANQLADAIATVKANIEAQVAADKAYTDIQSQRASDLEMIGLSEDAANEKLKERAKALSIAAFGEDLSLQAMKEIAPLADGINDAEWEAIKAKEALKITTVDLGDAADSTNGILDNTSTALEYTNHELEKRISLLQKEQSTYESQISSINSLVKSEIGAVQTLLGSVTGAIGTIQGSLDSLNNVKLTRDDILSEIAVFDSITGSIKYEKANDLNSMINELFSNESSRIEDTYSQKMQALEDEKQAAADNANARNDALKAEADSIKSVNNSIIDLKNYAQELLIGTVEDTYSTDTYKNLFESSFGQLGNAIAANNVDDINKYSSDTKQYAGNYIDALKSTASSSLEYEMGVAKIANSLSGFDLKQVSLSDVNTSLTTINSTYDTRMSSLEAMQQAELDDLKIQSVEWLESIRSGLEKEQSILETTDQTLKDQFADLQEPVSNIEIALRDIKANQLTVEQVQTNITAAANNRKNVEEKLDKLISLLETLNSSTNQVAENTDTTIDDLFTGTQG